jgi:hypothetical protein
MAEGPRLADFWNVERMFAAVFTAWVALRQRNLEHNTVLIEGWTRAAGVFAQQLNQRAEKGEPPLETLRELLTLWGETANEVMLEMQRSEAFLRTQREVLKASTDLRLAQQAVAEYYGEMLGFPTRAELDDVHRSITDLRRELRTALRTPAVRAALRGPPRGGEASDVPQPPAAKGKTRRRAAAKKDTAA